MTLMVDAVLALVALEAALLAFLGRAALLPHLLAGFLLLLAMRLALSDAGLPAVGATLLCAGLAHVLDMARTLRRP